MRGILEGIDKAADRKAKYDALNHQYYKAYYSTEKVIERHEKAKYEVLDAELRVKMAMIDLESYRVALAEYAKARKDAEKALEKLWKAMLAAQDRLPTKDGGLG